MKVRCGVLCLAVDYLSEGFKQGLLQVFGAITVKDKRLVR